MCRNRSLAALTQALGASAAWAQGQKLWKGIALLSGAQQASGSLQNQHYICTD